MQPLRQRLSSGEPMRRPSALPRRTARLLAPRGRLPRRRQQDLWQRRQQQREEQEVRQRRRRRRRRGRGRGGGLRLHRRGGQRTQELGRLGDGQVGGAAAENQPDAVLGAADVVGGETEEADGELEEELTVFSLSCLILGRS